MDIYRFFPDDVARLLQLEESGMGFQHIRSELRFGPWEPIRHSTELFVLNARHAVRDAELAEFGLRMQDASRERAGSPWRALLMQEGVRVVPAGLGPIELLPPDREREGLVEKVWREMQRPAEQAEQETADHPESFRRFSAFRNDRRITPNKGLVPGTYATTAQDAQHVQDGSTAVERYALPNPAPAIYRFRIDLREKTRIQRGRVKPAFGHRGGGVEVIFPQGTSDGTVSLDTVLPPGLSWPGIP